ncbi:metal-dependent hydrolase [Pseudoalteromonas sp. A25]|uniref:metal-dependent hydrolase n=1 Tax=Pseudoalteromonas sp. A25 TaxID=116092 RepID=UPI001562B69C|nr:metal-dependent hydrolase [Pseudoalteromonas sp. A25]
MANFDTHFKASVISSAALTSTVLATELTTVSNTLMLFIIGSLAGLLPDLDADKSRSLNSLFSIFALSIAICLSIFISFDNLLALWLCAFITYVLIMYALKPLFERYTVHRGAAHSLLFVLMMSLIGIHLVILTGKSINSALLVGVSIAVGMLTHLILDECYSVDINNNELKASFGSALKPVSLNAPVASTLQLLVIIVAIYLLLPYQQDLLQTLQSWHNKLTRIPLMPNLDIFKQWL